MKRKNPPQTGTGVLGDPKTSVIQKVLEQQNTFLIDTDTRERKREKVVICDLMPTQGKSSFTNS